MEATTRDVLLKPLFCRVEKEGNEDEKGLKLREEGVEQCGSFLVKGDDDATQLHL